MSDSNLGEKEKEKQIVIEPQISKDVDFGQVADIGLLNTYLANGSLTSHDIEIVAAHLDDHSVEESKAILEEAIEYHHGDSCLSRKYYAHMRQMVQGPLPGQTQDEWEALLKFDAFLIKDWSIYPEVRSVTRPIDEEEEPHYESIRCYIVSILWSCAGATLATFFAPRFPSISLSFVAVQILIVFTGKCFRYIPDWSFPVGFGRRFHFGGGPWRYKEQMLATAGMGVGNQTPYSLYVVLAMGNDHFYGFKEANSFGFIILLTLATNLMGFGISGLYRVFLIYPTRLVWFGILPIMKLSRVLVEDETHRENLNGWKLKGWEFFWLFSLVEFGWYWITDFVFKFFSTFDWVAWISPHNNNLLSVCGVNAGLGLNPFPTMDPSISQMQPLVQPFFASFGTLVGMFLSMLAICAMFWLNVGNSGYLTINSNVLYDNTGNEYKVNAILDSNNNLDEEKYQNYSLPYMSAGNIAVYGSFFMFYPALIVYSLLNYFSILTFSGKIFIKTMINPKKALASFDDRFSRAQRKYKEVPEWWYLLTLCICLAMGIACVEHYSFCNTPVWTIFFGVGLSAVFMIPCGVLFSTTNLEVSINVLFELIIGLTVKGNGSALMVSKAFATNFMNETDTFLSNLKTAHYCGISPRAMFRLQVINTIASSFVQAGLMVWQSTPGAIPGMCDLDSPDKFTCQNIRTYFNAAVQWGTIGPSRILKGGNGVYPKMKWVFLIGAGFPIPFWIIRRFVIHAARRRNWGALKEGGSRFRNHQLIRHMLSMEWINSINEIVILQGCQYWAPNNFMYYLPWLYTGLFSQIIVPKYWPRWWQKYNYLIYAASTVGYSYSALIMFFATSYNHIASINWWGNDTAISLKPGPRLNATLDAPDGYFGPRKGTFPR